MRPNHKTRLTALSEELTEVLIEEANPVNWPAHGVKIQDMEPVEHRARLAHKQNASATVGLLLRVQNLLGLTSKNVPADAVDSVDAAVRKAEKEAERIMATYQ